MAPKWYATARFGHLRGRTATRVQVNSALHPSGVEKSSTSSFGWGKGGTVTSAGWQVTLCDAVWHMSYRSGVATLRTAIQLLLTYLLLPVGLTSSAAGFLASVLPSRNMHRFQLGAWNRRTDIQANGSQHRSMPCTGRMHHTTGVEAVVSLARYFSGPRSAIGSIAVCLCAAGWS